jgi:hypothetical protein
MLKAIENSLNDGALYRYTGGGEHGGPDEDGMVNLLTNYWAAVSKVFSDAWGKSPRKSRLMHGAGIVSMSFLMDAIADRRRAAGAPSTEEFERDLMPLKEVCSWTSGYWSFGANSQIRSNELQNTGKHIQMLTNHIIAHYKAKVWMAAAGD